MSHFVIDPTMRTILFWFAFAMVSLFAFAFVAAAVKSWRIQRGTGGRRPVSVNSLTEGYQLVRGKTIGPRLKSPLTGRDCVWWSVKVRVIDRINGEIKEVEVRDDQSTVMILCSEGFGTAAIEPTGTTLRIGSEVRDWIGEHYPPEHTNVTATPGSLDAESLPMNVADWTAGRKASVDGQMVSSKRYRYREMIIVPDSDLFVLGKVSRNELQPELDDDEDEFEDDSEGDDEGGVDGDGGKIEDADGYARQLREAQWIIEPERPKPYIISVLSPDAWGADNRKNLLRFGIPGLLLLVLDAYLLWVRFIG